MDIDTDSGVDKEARRKLITASILCFIFMLGEIVGGYLANSLAIMTDAAHLLTDFASFMISLLAIYLAARPPSQKMSFGWYRAEVMGALMSVLMIWLVTGVLVYLAIRRIIDAQYDVDGKIMLITSMVGVVVNIIMAFTLHQYGHGHSHGGISHGHSHAKPEPKHTKTPVADGNCDTSINKPEQKENINVRAAYIHVIGDLLQSIGVMVAAIVIYFHPHLKIADPICTFIFSFLVLLTTINILKDALQVLMEGTPRGLDFNEVKSSLYEIPGVVEVHNLRMWSLTTTKAAVSVHLALSDHKDSRRVLRVANKLLRQRFNIKEVTIQLEQFLPEMADCKRCQEH
ncbi:hypothetical protein Ciccas_007090 [Cichlidogyrus casuarinus]|uniref:Zinc transporter 2 n=1 Tax=Cichlidogyrus casuarinus TaxID=1844966 RepID=A0ABD2Q3V6_9PLAT